MDRKKIVILDDDEGIIEVLKSQLLDYEVVGFVNAKEALSAMQRQHFDLFILDYFLYDTNGAEVIKNLRKFDKKIYIFLLTGYKDDIPGIETLERLDIQFYCEKSVDIENIIINIKSVLKSIDFIKSENVETFGARLKRLRTIFHLSQDDIARIVGGRGRTTIGNWEAGLAEPNIDALKKLATFFGVSIDYLLCHETDYRKILQPDDSKS
ncbi:MAG TPA: response regulator [Bacillota bacterium]